MSAEPTTEDAVTKRLHVVTTWVLVAVALGALGAGVPALAWAAGVAAWPTVARWLLVVVLDGAMVAMTLAAVRRRREGLTAGWRWTAVGALVALSAVVQSWHALTLTTAAMPPARLLAALVGALPPVVVLTTTHAWLDGVAPAPTKARRRVASRPGGTPTATSATAKTVAASTATTPAPAALTSRRAPTTTSRSAVDPSVRAEAEAMLAAGATVAVTANALGLAETTVRRWRDALTAGVRGTAPEEPIANERLVEAERAL